MELYAHLKDIPRPTIPEKVQELLKMVDLYDSRKTLSKNLSGGQKRKLSIGFKIFFWFNLILFILTFVL